MTIKMFVCDDYFARQITGEDGVVTYTVKYRSATHNTDELALTETEFELYYGDSKKLFQRQEKADKRHRSDGELEELEATYPKFPAIPDFSADVDFKFSLEAVLATCTPVQRRRFDFYRSGYTYDEIAVIENCTNTAIKASVSEVKKKIKILFD